MDTVTLVTFAWLAAVLVITPGPDMLFIVSTSMSAGARGGVAAVLGVALGGFLHAVFVAYGLSAVLAASQTAYRLITLAGAAYLVWVGVKTIFQASRLDLAAQAPDRPFGEMFRRGLITNLTNPKVLLFSATFYPQFADPGAGPVSTQILVLGLVVLACFLAIMGPIALSSGRFGRFLARHPGVGPWITRASGTIFVALGLDVLVSGGSRFVSGR